MPTQDIQLDVLARRRARAKLGWFTHAVIYLVVNLGLVALSLASGRHWAVYPLLGWGLGLLMHWLAVWVFAPGRGVFDRMVERERARLVDAKRDAW